ncbi:hypothetical protein VST63_11185 [Mycolicibacterium sp. 050232]|uniref:hypothetical protein n=1 Tax=Mycolicibacterium sp. 050232 TaxID=3113982 RepID=UPI002E2E6CDE|nr:hypothetical protein [Mycolicibacterium sp. 050232]MED5812924.1 hypothetical protein [Mycolicibacterium sp. 050232]
MEKPAEHDDDVGPPRRPTAADYDAMAADYEAHPVRADEILSIELGPGLPDDPTDYEELARKVEAGEYTASNLVVGEAARRRTGADYDAEAAAWAEGPPPGPATGPVEYGPAYRGRAEEVAGPIEVNPNGLPPEQE